MRATVVPTPFLANCHPPPCPRIAIVCTTASTADTVAQPPKPCTDAVFPGALRTSVPCRELATSIMPNADDGSASRASSHERPDIVDCSARASPECAILSLISVSRSPLHCPSTPTSPTSPPKSSPRPQSHSHCPKTVPHPISTINPIPYLPEARKHDGGIRNSAWDPNSG